MQKSLEKVPKIKSELSKCNSPLLKELNNSLDSVSDGVSIIENALNKRMLSGALNKSGVSI